MNDGTDVTTLAEVEHLLRTTEFASLDDLAGRAGDLGTIRPSRRNEPSTVDLTDGGAQLPRRR